MGFRFQQFEVQDDRCAMKVGTDGVLLGCWAQIGAPKLAQKVLDIGAGCGLISLFLAQRFEKAQITGIEIDPSAATQCAENFERSPFPNRLQVVPLSLQQWDKQETGHWDAIVSNPPYFQNSLTCPDPSRKTARHTTLLDYETLFCISQKHLVENGHLELILPAQSEAQILPLAQQMGFSVQRICRVFGRANKPCKRLLLDFILGYSLQETQETRLVLETSDSKRTADYQALTKDFYLPMS